MKGEEIQKTLGPRKRPFSVIFRKTPPRKKQEPLKRVASVSPLNVVSRAGLVGTKGRQGFSPGPFRMTELHRGRGHGLSFPEERSQGIRSLIHSTSSHGIPDICKPGVGCQNLATKPRGGKT